MKNWKVGRHREENASRLNYLVLIILLAALSLLVRLFFVQVWQHQSYLKAAVDQQQYSKELESKRGKIYIQDKDGVLHTLAANRDFVRIYVVPSKITEGEKLAQELFNFFKKPSLAKEIDETIAKEEGDKLEKDLASISSLSPEEQATKTIEIRNNHNAELSSQLYQETKIKRREELIKVKETEIKANYLKIFSKTNDPYEPLENKIDVEQAKAFHVALSGGDLKVSDLEYKNGRMIDLRSGKESVFNGLGYAGESYRVYLEGSVASHLLGFVSNDKSEIHGVLGKHGSYGLEGYFDDELFGKYGSIKSERGLGGLVIAQDREYKVQQDGYDLVTTIDRNVQFFVDKVLKESGPKYSAESASILVLNPATGEIIAMASWPDFDPNKYNEVKDSNVFNNPIIFDQYEPGSVFKAVTMAGALDKGKVSPYTTYNDPGQMMIEGWPKYIKNSDYDTFGAHGKTTMIQVLEKSLNTGSIFAMNSIGAKTFADYVTKFGFGEKTGIELEGEAPGNISSITGKKIRPISAANASFGQGISVTPLQMALAFGALANGGKLMKPYVVKEIRDGETKIISQAEPKVVAQVISESTSALIKGMLVNVVENGHSKRAQVAGYYIGGKTGTAQVADKGGYGDKLNHTFVGFAPVDNPRFVILVKLYNPRGFEYAESTAVPIAHQVIEFLLNYWQVPKTR
jgi:cell division protein FtsI/penicillin-binding protein 2